VLATQSTHKLLAGLSQASQILVQDAGRTALDEQVFNEAFLMHTSTSPQYAIIALLRRLGGHDGPPGRHRPGRGIPEGGA
jgi:arginine/lysine/ornithine decarboxylase